jgi:hypothetical protein
MQAIRLSGLLFWFTSVSLALAADATPAIENSGANSSDITLAEVSATAATITCPTCGHVNPATANFCSNCGANLERLHVAAVAEASPTPAEKKRPLWEFILPARTHETTHGSALSDKPAPLQLQGFPERPKPIIEIGQNPFLGSGPIAPGFTIPTGAVWQPDFIVFGTGRMAIQTFDDGTKQITEWANRLDLYGNLFLTPTERILIGFRPVDKVALNSDKNTLRFSGYRFQPHDGPQNGLNAYVTTLFFQGEFSELFPNLEGSTGNLDYSFAIGRQPLNFESGIMINEDLIDAIGVTRTSLFELGSSSLRTTAIFSWDQLNRNNNVRDNSAKLFGLFTTADYAKTTVDFDLAFVTAHNSTGGDGFYVGVGSTQRFGLINSTFRVNSSVALDRETPAVSTGTLLFGQLSTTLPESQDIVYLDGFWGIENYSSAARGPAAGGPLGQTGILFAAQGLGSYGAPLGNRANNSVGGAIGYQMFLGGTDHQLTFELGGRATTSHVRFFETSQPNSIAMGTNYQVKIGQHSVLILGGFVGFPEDRSTAYGLRTEWLLKF